MSAQAAKASYGLGGVDGCRNCTARARHHHAGQICAAADEGYAPIPAEGWCGLWMSRDGARSAITDRKRAALAAAEGRKDG